MTALRKILCALGIHQWGSPQDHFPTIPSEEDCAHILYNREWPNYPYRPCVACSARQSLPKIYVQIRWSQ